MKTIHSFLIFLTITIFNFTANSEEVYESTTEEGVIQFSDRPSSDAHVIDVEPNVVDVEEPKSTKSESSTTKHSEQAPIEQSETIHQDVADDYERDRLRDHKVGEEHREHDKKDVVHKPKHKAIH